MLRIESPPSSPYLTLTLPYLTLPYLIIVGGAQLYIVGLNLYGLLPGE